MLSWWSQTPGVDPLYPPALTTLSVGALTRSCRNPSSSWTKSSLKLKREPCKTRPLCHLPRGKKPEASQGNGLPLLFSLVCFPECIFSQNNLIVWIFFLQIILYLQMSITLTFSEDFPKWLKELFAEWQYLVQSPSPWLYSLLCVIPHSLTLDSTCCSILRHPFQESLLKLFAFSFSFECSE